MNMIQLPGFDLSGLERIGASVALVILAIAISRWQRADLEADLLIATVRGFVQLIAIGYLLEFIFGLNHPIWTTLLLAVMTLTAGWVAGSRAHAVPHARPLALLAIATGTALTLGTLVALGVFAYDPQTIIPIGGMVVGNAMTTCALTMNRLSDDLRTEQAQVQTALALGASGRQASLGQFRRALKSAMIPMIDTTKTVGLIKLPGAMTGMILAGASPLKAVQIQMIVMYMLVGATAFTGLSAAYLTYRQFFTPAHQLVLGQAG
jgi:putative ABC transport system permease protein